MSRFAVLTGLEIKKALRALPGLTAGAALMLLIVLAIAYTANGILNEKPDQSDGPAVAMGVVCNDDSKIMNMAKNMLTSIKSISETVKIEFVEADVAQERLESGEYIAVAVIPENAVDDIISGKNTPIELYFQPNAGYEAAAVKEVADAAVNMLASSQAGVYSVYDFYREHLKRGYIDDALDRLNDRYIKTVLLRERLFDNTEVVATGELEVAEYYTISGIVLFLFLFGMNSLTFIQTYKRETIVLLEQNGVGIAKQTAARFLGIFCVYIIFTAAATAFMSAALKTGTAMAFRLISAMLPAAAAVSAVVLLIQVYVKNKSSAVMLMFLLALFQNFVTGGLIPQLMLPEEVGFIGALTPAHYMIEQFRIVYMGDSGIWTNTLILLAVTAAALGLACAGMMTSKKDIDGEYI